MRCIRFAVTLIGAIALCGCAREETPVPDQGQPLDEGTVGLPDREGVAEVTAPPEAGETEVADICERLRCEETYKVFADLDDEGRAIQVCFRWTCDPVRGQCVIEFLQGVRCDDGLDCTRMDTCVDGRCVGLVDECGCEGDTGQCSDGDPCTIDDHCVDGKCVAKVEKDCSAYEVEAGDCREVGCFLGVCMWSPRPEGERCASPNRCFHRGECDGLGQCLPDLDAHRDCDDQNPCTTDGCDETHPDADPATGCYHVFNSDPCDDQNACTENDRCHAGKCAGTLVDCEDGNPCTDDRPETCDPKKGCQHPVLDDIECDDGNECTPVSRCVNGVCVGAVVCDDGDQCTDDRCGLDKRCEYIKHTRSCNDGDPCTHNDRCGQDGVCRGVLLPCPGNSCNDGACEVIGGQGKCVLKPKPVGTSCDDGNGCTTGDVCGVPGPDGAASCKGQPVTCAEKADECNEGVCIPVDAQQYVCVANPKVGKPPCEDGDLCTVGDVCQYGKCLAGLPKVCEPATDPCEQNLCEPATGLCTLSLKTGSCSDGNACTVGDVCVAGTSPEDGPGKCVGTLINCNDQNVCTLDSCDREVGCRHVPRIKECSNTTGLACVRDADCPGGGQCVEVACADDGNPCTRDVCAEDGTCKHIGRYKECRDGRPCLTDADCSLGEGPCAPVPCTDDGNECTVDYCWWDGTCRHFQRVRACADGIPCTRDSECGGAPGSCKDVGPVPCDDRDKCTLNDVCTLEKVCKGMPRDCTDYETLPSGVTVKNVCTDDFCDQRNPAADPETGCYYVFNSNPCDDRDPCTRADKCSGALCDACFFGHCQGPILRDCRDNNPCTLDGCDQFHPGADSTGCWHEVVAPGTRCDDLNLCTFNDRCNAMGVCVGDFVDCNDENQCTNEIGCDPVNGCIRTLVPNGTSCDDANACTFGDRCFAGVCLGPNQVNCNDNNPCTVDWCLPTEGCQHVAYTCDDGFSCTTDTCRGDGSCQFTLKPGWCLIDGVCYANGTRNPANECQACNPSMSNVAWSNLGSGVACSDDGVLCTLDRCDGLGTCIHPIASDWCRISGVCYFRDTLNPANDCQACNPSQSQTVWTNRPSGAPCTDDGDWCTVDQCDGLGTCTHTTTTESCKIKGKCYAAGTINPANDCQECNPALSKSSWSNRTAGASCADEGVPCTLDQCNGLGSCIHPIAPDWCRISGVCYERDTLNPTNDCQACNPSQSQTVWTNRPSGAPCTDDGDWCTLDQCNGFGSCRHVVGSDKCLIDGSCYTSGTTNPLNPCQVCNPSQSQASWSNKASGTSCPDDGLLCTHDVCNADGLCSHPVKSGYCLIAGECKNSGEQNPSNQCQECNSAQNPTAWSAKSNGTLCSDGNACTITDVCYNGVCQSGSAKTCTALDQCHEAGTCDPATGLCSNPKKPNGTLCNDGNQCTVGETCQNGECAGGTNVVCFDGNPCTHDLCAVGTGCYYPPKADGTDCSSDCAENATCQQGHCQGTLRPYGFACTPDAYSCTNDICNGTGICIHPIQPGKCLIGATCYDEGATNGKCEECKPSVSQTNWTYVTGRSCNDGNPCTHTDVCVPGGSGDPGCQGTSYSCNDGKDCTNDFCDGLGGCSNPIQPGKCLIGGVCYNDGATNGRCEECEPSASQTAWTYMTGKSCNDGNACTHTDVCVAGGSGDSGCQGTSYSCTDDGVYCNGNEVCDGLGGCSHTGNPCPGHNTGPNCNDSCNEAAGNCTANDANGTPCGGNQACCNGVCQTSCP